MYNNADKIMSMAALGVITQEMPDPFERASEITSQAGSSNGFEPSEAALHYIELLGVEPEKVRDAYVMAPDPDIPSLSTKQRWVAVGRTPSSERVIQNANTVSELLSKAGFDVAHYNAIYITGEWDTFALPSTGRFMPLNNLIMSSEQVRGATQELMETVRHCAEMIGVSNEALLAMIGHLFAIDLNERNRVVYLSRIISEN